MKRAAVVGMGSFFEQHYAFIKKKYEIVVIADNYLGKIGGEHMM